MVLPFHNCMTINKPKNIQIFFPKLPLKKQQLQTRNCVAETSWWRKRKFSWSHFLSTSIFFKVEALCILCVYSLQRKFFFWQNPIKCISRHNQQTFWIKTGSRIIGKALSILHILFARLSGCIHRILLLVTLINMLGICPSFLRRNTWFIQDELPVGISCTVCEFGDDMLPGR
jgi:hypothetical protein